MAGRGGGGLAETKPVTRADSARIDPGLFPRFSSDGLMSVFIVKIYSRFYFSGLEIIYSP
jgi:hypothetical protein